MGAAGWTRTTGGGRARAEGLRKAAGALARIGQAAERSTKLDAANSTIEELGGPDDLHIGLEQSLHCSSCSFIAQSMLQRRPTVQISDRFSNEML